MKIKPYFKSTLTKALQGKNFHNAGAEVVMNMEVQTKSLGNFLVMLPDPVSLNLNNAQNFIDKCEKLKERIISSKRITVFSKILGETDISGRTNEEIKKLDPEANILRDFDNEKIFEYMQSSMGMVVSLIVGIESFLNLIIPFDYRTVRVNKNGEKINLDKEQIVRKFSIEDKIEIVSEIKHKEDVKQQKFWNTFKEVKDLRDDIIHFKKMDKKIDQMWNPIIVSLFDGNLQRYFDDIVNLINYLEPKYLEMKS